MSFQTGINVYMLYKIVTRIAQSWEETDAFRLGLIDGHGVRLRSPQTEEEKDAYGLFDRFVFNIKRLLHKVNLNSKLSTYVIAAYLLREEYETLSLVEWEDFDHDALVEEVAANCMGASSPSNPDSAIAQPEKLLKFKKMLKRKTPVSEAGLEDELIPAT
jgi:hypothetical protein